MESEQKGLGFDVKIKVPDQLRVIQLAQQFGIAAWDEGDHVVLSGIDEVEIGRFLRQFKIMDDAQVAVLFGGRLAGHKSLEDGEKAMADEQEEYPDRRQEEGLSEDETPSDQAEPTEPGEEELVDDEKGIEGEEGMEGGYEGEEGLDEGPTEKLGAQVLRELHNECMEFLEKYDPIIEVLDHEGVRDHLTSKLQRVVADMEELEATFSGHYPEYPGLDDKAIMEGEEGGEEFSDEALPEPSPDEVVEGMAQGTETDEGGAQAENPREKFPKEVDRGQKDLEDGQKSLDEYTSLIPVNEKAFKHPSPFQKTERNKEKESENRAKQEHAWRAGGEDPEGPGMEHARRNFDEEEKEMGKSLLNDSEVKTLAEVGEFMGKLGGVKFLDNEIQMDAWHYAKSLNMIQNRVDKVFGEIVAGSHKKGSLLPKPHGHAGEGEPEEVDVNKPSGPTKYKPGTEPLQQFGKDAASPHMKGSILDTYGNAFEDPLKNKDQDSHIANPTSKNAVAKPGADKEHMGFGHAGDWPKKGSLVPAPSGNAGEGEPEEVHINKPSSNPQAKPGADKAHQWFGKPAEWPCHKKNIEEASTFLKSVALAKDFSESQRAKALVFKKGFECFNTQVQAVGVTHPSSNPQAVNGQDSDHQPFGKDASWPQVGSKNLDSYLDNRDKKLAELNATLEKLVSSVKAV